MYIDEYNSDWLNFCFCSIKSIYTRTQRDIHFYPDKENSPRLIYIAKNERQKNK